MIEYCSVFSLFVCQYINVCSVVRKHVGQLPAERGDLAETGATVTGHPWWNRELWHVRVCRHSYIIYTPGGDLLSICHR